MFDIDVQQDNKAIIEIKKLIWNNKHKDELNKWDRES